MVVWGKLVRLLLGLRRNDVIFALSAYVDNALLFGFAGDFMHRLSLRAKIAAWL